MRTDWIVVDAAAQVMRCNRCKATEPLSIINGRRVSFACRILNAFVKEHENCKEQ